MGQPTCLSYEYEQDDYQQIMRTCLIAHFLTPIEDSTVVSNEDLVILVLCLLNLPVVLMCAHEDQEM